MVYNLDVRKLRKVFYSISRGRGIMLGVIDGGVRQGDGKDI